MPCASLCLPFLASSRPCFLTLLLIPSSSICSGRRRDRNEVVEKAREWTIRGGVVTGNKNGKGGGWWGKSEPSQET